MSRPGGQTTFSGTKFQAEITTLFLGRLLDPRPRGDDQMVIAVRPECDVEAEVDDILVRYKDRHTEWFQVKENIQNSGKTWNKMWGHFKDQLPHIKHRNDRIVLLLGNSYPWTKDLREICQHAQANRVQEWLKEGMLSGPQLKILGRLGEILDIDQREDLHPLMSCIDLRIMDADPRE